MKALPKIAPEKRGQSTREAYQKINPDGVSQFTQKQLTDRWGVKLRTVQRDLRRYKGSAAGFIGIIPIFTIDEIERIETARLLKRSTQIGLSRNGHGIISVKEAMRRGGRNGKARE